MEIKCFGELKKGWSFRRVSRSSGTIKEGIAFRTIRINPVNFASPEI